MRYPTEPCELEVVADAALVPHGLLPLQVALLTGHELEEAYAPNRRVQYAFVPAHQKRVSALGPAEYLLLPLGEDRMEELRTMEWTYHGIGRARPHGGR